MIDGYILVIGASVKHATIVEAPVRSSHWCRYWSCNCNCKWYVNDFSWKILTWTGMWAVPWFAKWSMSASWSLCGKVWNPIVVADTCLLVLFTKKTTYEQFSAIYLTPKSGTDGFTFCVNLCCSGVKFALLVIATPPRITTCVRIFVLCDLAKKVFSNILEQKQFKSISYNSRTKTT